MDFGLVIHLLDFQIDPNKIKSKKINFLEGLGREGNLLAFNFTRQKIKSSKSNAVGGSGRGKTFINLLISLVK